MWPFFLRTRKVLTIATQPREAIEYMASIECRKDILLFFFWPGTTQLTPVTSAVSDERPKCDILAGNFLK